MKRNSLLVLLMVFGVMMLQAQQNKSDHTFLGVDINTAMDHDDGVYVNGVYKGFGAVAAGLKPGDILRSVNSKKVRSFNELVETLDNYQPGQQVELSFIRNNVTQSVNATLSAYPEFLKYNRGDFNSGNYQHKANKATLGINVESMWEQYALLVTGFSNESPAKKAGLQVGDILLKLENYEFATIEELNYSLSKFKPNDKVMLTVKRDGQQKQVNVTLGEYVTEAKEKKEFKEKIEKKEKKESKLI
jgi:serine protease Do